LSNACYIGNIEVQAFSVSPGDPMHASARGSRAEALFGIPVLKGDGGGSLLTRVFPSLKVKNSSRAFKVVKNAEGHLGVPFLWEMVGVSIGLPLFAAVAPSVP
jgi:hypothetical protein